MWEGCDDLSYLRNSASALMEGCSSSPPRNSLPRASALLTIVPCASAKAAPEATIGCASTIPPLNARQLRLPARERPQLLDRFERLELALDLQ